MAMVLMPRKISTSARATSKGRNAATDRTMIVP
jgi:hypothetical protein